MMSRICGDNVLLSLTVNDDVFGIVRAEIFSNRDARIPQPVMIVGPEGSGKTTVLRRLYESFCCMNRPCVWIDGRSLFSSADIADRIKDTSSVLFIDDMDYYFTRCTYDEQYGLRRILNDDGAPMLVGTVSKVLPALAKYEAPFFEGTRLVYINPVSEDVVASLFPVDSRDRILSVLRLLPPTIKSLEIAEYVICSGNNPDKDIEKLLSAVSEKYRGIYGNQPINSQHILNALGCDSNGLAMPEIREKTGLPTSSLTAYLKSLANQNIIAVDKSIKKSNRYRIVDPLFRLWLEPRSLTTR